MMEIVRTSLSILAVVLAVAAFAFARQADNGFYAFQGSLCAAVKSQAASSKSFYSLVQTLDQRALAREVLDKQAGDFRAAAADADSARLYSAVLTQYHRQTRGTHPQLCT